MRRQRDTRRSKASRRICSWESGRQQAIVPELLETRILLSAYLVTSNADDGSAGTLRDAVAQVNLGNYSEIDFAGPTNITVTSGLQVTNPVTIKGATDGSGDPAVVIDGGNAVVNGLELDGANSAVSGLVIDNFTGDGLLLVGSGISVQGNFIGADATGTAPAANGTGIEVQGADAVIRSNLISGNSYEGILVSGNNATLAANKIGTDLTGTQALPNCTFVQTYGDPNLQAYGAVVVNQASGVTIGGTTAADRNLISGNAQDGVAFTNCAGTGNVVEGNYIGLDVSGENPLGNDNNGVDLGTSDGLACANVRVVGNVISANGNDGIFVDNSNNNTIAGNYVGTDAAGNVTALSGSFPVQGNQVNGIEITDSSDGNVIGGPDAASRNVISGNNAAGIYVDPGSAQAATTIIGNYIGTNASGAGDVTMQGNAGDGIDVYSGAAVIGRAGAGNVISGNQGYGLYVTDTTTIQGNRIGIDAGGNAFPNRDVGVVLAGDHNVVGGASAGEGNVIADNSTSPLGPPAGVQVLGVGNSIRGNSIYSNGLGIDLGGDGVTANTPGGPHTGANDLQNFPVLSAITTASTGDLVSGTLNGARSTTFTIDFYSTPAPDASGYGEGKTYLGSTTVTTNASGDASFSRVSIGAAPDGENYFCATATAASGNTSEFSACVAGAPAPTPPGGSGTPAVQVVTATRVASSMKSAPVGHAVTFNAVVSAPGHKPTGSVVFTVDGQAYPAAALSRTGHASLTVTELGPGPHSVSAAYGGDGACAGSVGTCAQQVNRAHTTVGVRSSLSASTSGQPVTLTAVVVTQARGWTPGGAIDFLDGAADLGSVALSADGSGRMTASFTTSALTVGRHSIKAVYSGDANFVASAKAAGQTVKPLRGTISGRTLLDLTGDGLSADDQPLGRVAVRLFRDVNGNGILDAGDKPAGRAGSANGTGSFTFANLLAGNYIVEEVTPRGLVQTAPTGGVYAINLVGGALAGGNDFANARPASTPAQGQSHHPQAQTGHAPAPQPSGHQHGSGQAAPQADPLNGPWPTLPAFLALLDAPDLISAPEWM